MFDPKKTGFENSKTFWAPPGSLIAGRYEVDEILGTAAFSTALQCVDLSIEDDGHEENDDAWVCLKVIKEGKDFFDQSLDEIKLLQYINRHGDSEKQCFLRLVDFFYHKEHLFIVSELLRENLYEFGRTIVESGQPPYFTIPRLKKISHQCLKALAYIHGLGLIHCDIKPENIVMKSYSRCLCKVIDFGSSCFASDRLTTYIQSRSYRAPEVIIGHTYDGRIDIWSLGAVLAEMYAGYVLFQNDSVPRMLARITAILGPFPRTMLLRGRDTHKYFTTDHIVYERPGEDTEEERNSNEGEDGDSGDDTKVASKHGTLITGNGKVDCSSDSNDDRSDGSNNSRKGDEPDVYLIRPKRTSLAQRMHLAEAQSRAVDRLKSKETREDTPGVDEMASEDEIKDMQAVLFIDFVQQMLTLNPEERPTASTLLQHPFLADVEETDVYWDAYAHSRENGEESLRNQTDNENKEGRVDTQVKRDESADDSDNEGEPEDE